MSDALVAVSGLGLERGGRVLVENFDLQLRRGEMLLVEGANGAGKTTLLRSMAGLSRLGQTGEIHLATDKVLFLGHRPGIKQLLTARENLDWYCRGHGLDPQGVDSALQQVGLYGYEDVFRIRVGFYRVLYSVTPTKLVVIILKVGQRKEIYR